MIIYSNQEKPLTSDDLIKEIFNKKFFASDLLEKTGTGETFKELDKPLTFEDFQKIVKKNQEPLKSW